MDPISLFMIAVLGMLIYFMIRNSRKQRKTQEELADKLKPGADVMTSFGLYATITELDDENNVATLDVGKGVLIKVHRQTLTKVVEDESADVAAEPDASEKSS
ncbi:preprotein translocase subunit YajC [Pontimonas sp.]|jgi:preprotein translocase subunit YajC|nr:preprotein translocase subunit YajC [Pontimonas sp.]MDA9786885.1 preprotein translocase subunit YajC [Pontimonas sp.]